MFSRFRLSFGRSARRALRRVPFDAHVVLLGLTLLALTSMGWGYVNTLKPIQIIAGGDVRTVFSNQTTVAGILNDAGIVLVSEDQVFPALAEPVSDQQSIEIHFAYPLRVQADGDTISHRTQTGRVGDALGEAAILLKPGDRILIDGRSIDPNTPLPQLASQNSFAPPSTLDIAIQRAVPIEIEDNGALTTYYTTAPTLGEALRQAGLVVYLGDYVTPDLGMPVQPGWQVYIRRSVPATIHVDGRTIRTRTRANTISGLLSQEGIKLENLDYAQPKPDQRVSDGMSVTVYRVREDILTESESIPFQTVWQADPTLEIDNRQTVQAGVQGVKKRQIRIRYENNREVRRSLDREWIDSAPVTQLFAYGTKIIPRDLTLPDGSVVQYWRKLNVLATSYSAATSGKASTHPEFGKTFLGWQAGTGIVAVDPRVINLRTKLYVPGYGLGQAGDTGGRIKGRRIDLGYDDPSLVLWYKWVDVYLLTPVPPSDQIPWVIADAPRSSRGN